LSQLESSGEITYSNGSADIASVINWLKSYSSIDSALSITVPSGSSDQYEVGIMGNFIDPGTWNSNGSNCVQTQSSLAVNSATLFGHTPLTSDILGLGAVTLDINVLMTNPVAASGAPGEYSMTSTLISGTTAVDDASDWLQFDTSLTSPGTSRLESVSYLNGLINISVDNSGSNTFPAKYYLPRIPLSYTLTFSDGSTSAVSGSGSTTSISLTGASPATASYNVTSY